MTKILLVDDHGLVVEGLKAVLQRNENFEVVGEAYTAEEGIKKALLFNPDIVLMDIRLPDFSGIEACREIKAQKPHIQVIMLTSYADEEAVFASIMAGAAGYVLKQVKNQSLLQAVEAVSRGEGLLDPSVTGKVLARMKEMTLPGKDDGFNKLSNQEKKILLQIVEGKSNKEIAQSLFLGEKTVRNYVSSIFSKLQLENRSQAIAFGYKHNLVSSDVTKDKE